MTDGCNSQPTEGAFAHPPQKLTLASRTAVKPRQHILSPINSGVTHSEINGFDLTEEDTTLGIFPTLPPIKPLRQNGTRPLSLFRGENATDSDSAPTSPSPWQHQRLGTVSHTALGLSTSPVDLAPTRFALLQLSPEPDQSRFSHDSNIASSRYYDSSRSNADNDFSLSRSNIIPLTTSSLPFSNNHSSQHTVSGEKGRRRTGTTCSPAGLSGLLRPSVLLKSSWRKLSTMERPKLYSLVGLVVQSSALALTMRYSRTTQDKQHRYSTPTAVVISEMIKVIICIMAVTISEGKSLMSQLSTLSNTKELVKSSVPALLYTVQNNLLFVAVTYLDAATFQVTYQLKILTTAVFSVCFLRRKLDIIHWSALVMLTCGVGLVQIPGAVKCSPDSPGGCQLEKEQSRDMVLGVAAVLTMCVSSGFAGVYTEKILKSGGGSAGSMWVKNTRLSVSSVLVGLLYLYGVEGSVVMERGFLYGYQAVTWLVILQQAVLGLLTALVMKYADNIIKGFASSIAIVITTFVSAVILLDLHLSCSYLVGASVVMGSALLYNVDRTGDTRSADSVV